MINTQVYGPIVRGPTQKDVWGLAKRIAQAVAERHPEIKFLRWRPDMAPWQCTLDQVRQEASSTMALLPA